MSRATTSLPSSEHLKTWEADLDLAKRVLHLSNQLAQRAVRLSISGLSFLHWSPTDFLRRFDHFVQHNQVALQDVIEALEFLAASSLAQANLNQIEFDLLDLLKATKVQAAPAWDQAIQNRWSVARPVVLFGFGRIGRLLARILSEQAPNHAFYLAAIVVRGQDAGDLAKRIRLFNQDSVHGAFSGVVKQHPDKPAMLINGQEVLVIYADDPAKVDYETHGIKDALVVDNTGKWRDAEGLGLHLQSPGASQVLLTAPGKGDVPNIVFGLNHQKFARDSAVLSAASCTTNAICPVLSVMDQAFSLEYGHVETIHAYTNDQNLLDNYHKADRRGRSAALNMVITETGAARAVAKVLPHLGSKLSGNAIRVPVPDVSLAILKLDLARSVTREAVNQTIKQAVIDLTLNGQLGFSDNPDAVSADFIGTHYAALVDLQATIVHGKHVVLYVWYDNEYGYSVQLLRLIKYLSSTN